MPSIPDHTHMRRYRERLRAQGLRPIQLWVPDTRSPRFAEECRRQSLLVVDDAAEQRLLEELESLQDTDGWAP
ncbi:MAG: antitoxin MazE family protein [Gammaproteobacteria bacterium]